MSLPQLTARVAWLSALLLASGACDDVPQGDSSDILPRVEPPARDTAPGASNDTGNADGGAQPGAMPAEGGTPLPAIQIPTSGSICSVKVGAQCDGDEDCHNGEVCCGRFDSSPVSFGYTEIACSGTCGVTDFQLCHPGDDCPGDTASCRASLVLPYDFVGVCAAPADAPELTGEAIVGEVLCGQRTCVVGQEKCCYRARFEFASRMSVPLEPYCAPLDHACDCDTELPPPEADLDAGSDDGEAAGEGGDGDSDAG